MKITELSEPAKRRALDAMRSSGWGADDSHWVQWAVEDFTEVILLLGMDCVAQSRKTRVPAYCYDIDRGEAAIGFSWRPKNTKDIYPAFCKVLDEHPTWQELHEIALQLAELSAKYNEEAGWYVSIVSEPDRGRYSLGGYEMVLHPNDSLFYEMIEMGCLGPHDDNDLGTIERYTPEQLFPFAMWKTEQEAKGISLYEPDFGSIEEEVTNVMKRVNELFLEQVTTEWKWRDSDEYLLECADSNDVEFTEEGDPA